MNKKLVGTVVALGFLTFLVLVIGVGAGMPVMNIYKQVGLHQSMMSDVGLLPPSGGNVLFENEKQQGVTSSVKPSSKAYPVPSPYFPPSDDALDVDERVYKKSSSFGLIVDDITRYTARLNEYFVSIKGRVLSSSIGTSDKYGYAHLRVKVPVDKFDEANNRIKQDVVKVYAESISSLDETGQYTARTKEFDKLTDQKIEKEVALLSAKTAAEKKRLELEIKRLETRIKTAETKLKRVESNIDYATVSITVSDSEKYFKPYDRQGADIEATVKKAWRALIGVFYVLLYIAIWILMFSVLWVPVVLVIKRLFFHNKTKKT